MRSRSVPVTTLLELLLAAGLAWIISTPQAIVGMGLSATDPFRSTLVALPLVVAALRALGRPPFSAAKTETAQPWEALALLALVLLTLSRRSLGLWATDWFVAAGYLLLLGQHVARLLLRWRSMLGQQLPQRPPIAFFLLPLVVYLALQPWSAQHRQVDGDEPFYLLLAHSLAYDFDVDLANNYAQEDYRRFLDRDLEPQPGDPRGENGEIYSRHNLLLPLLLAPGYRLAGRAGAMITVAFMTALLAWMFLRLAAAYGDKNNPSIPRRPGAALLAYACLAFSPPLLFYSYQFWVEVPAALVLTVALDRLQTLRSSEQASLGRQGLRDGAILAAALVFLPLLKIRFALIAAAVAALAAFQIPWSVRQRALLLGSLGTGLAALMIHNQIRFGNFLKMHRWEELDFFSSSPVEFLRGFFGMFFDVAFGLMPSAPIWCLLVPALWLLLRNPKLMAGGARSGLRSDLFLIALPYLAVVAPRLEWYGGWSPPFRYPLVLLPLFALALVPVLERRQHGPLRITITALIALTVILALIWVVVPGWTYNFADGRTHLLEKASDKLGADVARLFPSTIRPRLATWLWPLGLLVLTPWILYQPRRRWRHGAAWGLVLLLGLAAALPMLARRAPTLHVEPEDAWVVKHRGWEFPDRWVLQRPNYRSGWVVPPKGWIEIPAVVGDGPVTIQLTARAVGKPVRRVPGRGAPGRNKVRRNVGTLTVHAENRHLADVGVGEDWETLEIGPFPVDIPDGIPLRLVLSGHGRPVAVDRLELQWQ